MTEHDDGPGRDGWVSCRTCRDQYGRPLIEPLSPNADTTKDAYDYGVREALDKLDGTAEAAVELAAETDRSWKFPRRIYKAMPGA